MAPGGAKPIVNWIVVLGVLSMAILPPLPLVVSAFGPGAVRPVWTESFGQAMRNSLWIGAGVSVVSLLAGWPLGLLAALYRFPARRSLVLIQALPLLLPSFLPCIGWSNLASSRFFRGLPMPDGAAGCVFVLGLQMVPLTFFATWAACQNLTGSQIDAARLHGGERSVLARSAQACGPVAILTALLGGILSLSDPGAPLIFGSRSVAVEIRTSFSALFDDQLAGRQSLWLAALVVSLATPLLVFGSRRLSAAVFAKQTRPAVPYPHRVMRWPAVGGLGLLSITGIALPTLGLCLPVLRDPMLDRARQRVVETAGVTLEFVGGAALIAVLFATILAMASAKQRKLRAVILIVLLVLIALPPTLAAIGTARVATNSPPQLDWLTRSRLTVVIVLGLRFLPVATVAMMRAVAGLSSSWSDAAQVHGISALRTFVRILLPKLFPAIMVGLLLVMALAAADITTTHFLQPPGSQSLPVAIFTVMANSPESLVASLCLLYLVGVSFSFTVALQLARLWSGRMK